MNSINSILVKDGNHHTNFQGAQLHRYLQLQDRIMLKDMEKISTGLGVSVSPGNVLVIGASIVRMPELLFRHNPHLKPFGLEINTEIVDYARDKNPDYEIRLWNTLEIPYLDNFFNYAVSIWEFHHWRCPLTILSLIWNKLKAGASVEIHDLYKEINPQYLYKFNMVTDELVARMKEHLQYTYSIDKIKNIFDASKFAQNYEMIVEDNFVKLIARKKT